MQEKIMVFRALSFMIIKRFLQAMTVIGLAGFGGSLVIIWALASFVSSWWWLLMIVWVPLLVLALAVRLGLGYLAVKVLYKQPLSSEQKTLLTNFVDKIQQVVGLRTMGWPLFALTNFKDLVFHRELRSTKKMISDTKSLKQDFLELEKKLQA